MPLLPVDGGVDVETWAVVGQRNALHVGTAEDATPNLDGRPQRALLRLRARPTLDRRITLVVVEDIDVPGVPLHRSILERLELVGDRAIRQHFTRRPAYRRCG